MSARFFQSSTPSEDQSIKCNDITVRGSVIANESIAVAKGISLNGALSFEDNTNGAVSGTISLPALTVYPQATATNANVAASTGGVAPQQFAIETFDGSIAAGASVSFQVFTTSVKPGKTLVLCSNDVSDNTLLTVNSFCSYVGADAFIITRHNFGTVAAAGKQKIIVKFIQSV